jgi:hypothetical protein
MIGRREERAGRKRLEKALLVSIAVHLILLAFISRIEYYPVVMEPWRFHKSPLKLYLVEVSPSSKGLIYREKIRIPKRVVVSKVKGIAAGSGKPSPPPQVSRNPWALIPPMTRLPELDLESTRPSLIKGGERDMESLITVPKPGMAMAGGDTPSPGSGRGVGGKGAFGTGRKGSDIPTIPSGGVSRKGAVKGAGGSGVSGDEGIPGPQIGPRGGRLGGYKVGSRLGEEPGFEGGTARNRIVYKKVYPRSPYLERNITIRLKFFVMPDGTVGDVIPLQKGDPELERLAILSMKSWEFEPLPEGMEDIQTGIITLRFRAE